MRRIEYKIETEIKHKTYVDFLDDRLHPSDLYHKIIRSIQDYAFDNEIDHEEMTDLSSIVETLVFNLIKSEVEKPRGRKFKSSEEVAGVGPVKVEITKNTYRDE